MYGRPGFDLLRLRVLQQVDERCSNLTARTTHGFTKRAQNPN